MMSTMLVIRFCLSKARSRVWFDTSFFSSISSSRLLVPVIRQSSGIIYTGGRLALTVARSSGWLGTVIEIWYLSK